MRRAGVLMLGAGVIALALGCGKHFQYTAGVCDCDPEPVGTVLQPYHGRPQAQPVLMTPKKDVKPPKMLDDEPKKDQGADKGKE